MSHRYRLARQAEADVLEIWIYIARDSISAADRLIDQFTETYELLSSNPGIGSTQEQYRPGLRAFPVGNYIIFFEPIADGIELYRVLHGARNLDDLL